MANRRKVEIFGQSFERSRTLATGLFGGAILFIAVGVAIGGPVGTILAAIGSTLGTTALVSFLADPFLKELLAQEIFERVGLRDSIVAAGLEDVASGAQLQLVGSLVGSRRIVVAPLDPFTWAREGWGEVLDVVRNAPAETVVILPSPASGPARVLSADRLGMTEPELERKLKELPEELLKAWDRADPAEGSTLQLLEQDALLSCGLLLCDACVVLETGPALRQSATDRLSLAQRFTLNSPYGHWIAEQLEDMILAGVPVGVRPVTAESDLPGRRTGGQGALPAGAAQPSAETAPAPALPADTPTPAPADSAASGAPPTEQRDPTVPDESLERPSAERVEPEEPHGA